MVCRHVPAVVRLGCCAAGIVWVVSAGSSRSLGASEALREALKQGLPKYDPEVRRKHLAATAVPATRERVGAAAEVKDAGEAEREKAPETSGEPLRLPDVTVQAQSGMKGEAALQLPRMVVRPRDEKAEGDAFETGAARDARLVKKHLTVFDRMFLNRFNLFGVSKEKRAREAEAIERSAQQLDEVAEALELRRIEQGETEEDRELRKIYLEALLSRPK